MLILLSLANNIVVKTYSYGEYILKAGDVPKGLYIISKGQCIACAEKLSMRLQKPSKYARIQKHKPNFTLRGSAGKNSEASVLRDADLFNEYFNPDNSSLNQVCTNTRVFQNDRIYADDNGKNIRDHVVYRDLVILEHLTCNIDGVLQTGSKEYFWGKNSPPWTLRKEGS